MADQTLPGTTIASIVERIGKVATVVSLAAILPLPPVAGVTVAIGVYRESPVAMAWHDMLMAVIFLLLSAVSVAWPVAGVCMLTSLWRETQRLEDSSHG
jgi:hypothetical protein